MNLDSFGFAVGRNFEAGRALVLVRMADGMDSLLFPFGFGILIPVVFLLIW